MIKNYFEVVLFALILSLASYSQQVKVSFTGSDVLTSAPITLDSVRVQNLTTFKDTVLRDPFIIILGTTTGVDDRLLPLRSSLELSGNFANPFTEQTRFRISTSTSGKIEVELYSMVGKLMASLRMNASPGRHEFRLDGRGLSPGVYILVTKDGQHAPSMRILKSGATISSVPMITYDGSITETSNPVMRKISSFASYRFIGYASGYAPDSILAAPTKDTTVQFHLTRIQTPPVIDRFTASKYNALVGESVTFEIKAHDANGDLTKVLIDYNEDGRFEDSTLVSGADALTTFTHAFAQAGSFRLQACVRDGKGMQAWKLIDTAITVGSSDYKPEILSFTSDKLLRAKSFDITLTAIVRDLNADLDFARIDFDGDGRFDDSLRITRAASSPDTVTFTTRYSSIGSFKPVLQVTDKRKNQTQTSLDSVIKVEEAILNSGTKVILKDELRDVVVSFDTTLTFIFRREKIAQLGLHVGTILVSDTGHGFLRRIIAIDTLAEGVRVTTVQGTLTEAFKEVSISFQRKLQPDSGHGIANPGEKIGRDRIFAGQQFSYSIDKLVLYDADSDTTTKHDQIRMNGSVAMDPNLNFYLEIDNHQVKRTGCIVDFTITPALETELNATLSKKLSLLLGNAAISDIVVTVPIPMHPFILPLIFTPKLNFTVGVEGGFSIGIKTSASTTETASTGVNYENGNWNGVGNESHTVTFIPPSFAENGSVKPFVESSLSVLLYGKPGPHFTITPYSTLNVDLLKEPLAELRGGIEAGAGYNVEALGGNLTNYEAPGVLNAKFKIWDSGLSKMPKISSINPASVTSGTEIMIRGEYFGGNRGTNNVYFRGGDVLQGNYYSLSAVDYPSWSDTEIRVRVPAGVNADGAVSVIVDGRRSNEVEYQINRLPVLTTTAVSDTTTNSAKSGGTITSDGGFPITARGICWNTTGNPTIADSITNDGTGIGAFTSELTGLDPNTKYFVRAYATNIEGTAYGNELSFTTLQGQEPVLTTTVVTNITLTSATSGGTITADGGFPVTARGVCWSTLNNPTIANTKTSDGAGNGTFNSNLTGLNPNTTYYVRAYATNSEGTGYGNEISFTTQQGQEPVLTTANVTNIAQTTATSGGTITSDGGFPVTARGVCWNTTGSPTITNTKTSDGVGTGIFISNLSGLNSNTTYYVRAYAKNSIGTGYGDEMSFTTQGSGGSGSVTIGTQIWTTKNLDVTTYRNGDPIPQVTNPTEWKNLTTGAWCYYNNDPATGAVYGKLYNWYAVNDPRGLAPTGWHVPTDAEWKTLEVFLGMMQSQADSIGWRGNSEGGKLKEAGTAHWLSPNTGATNSTGFTALPGGYRYGYVVSGYDFNKINIVGVWWSSTETSAIYAPSRDMYFLNAGISRTVYSDKKNGSSVRCVKD